MVLVFVSSHPILNGLLGTGGFLGSCIPSFKITTHILERNNVPGRNYEQVNVENELVLDDENSTVTYKKITHLKKKKQVNFNSVVKFRSLPKVDKETSLDLWWQSDDYETFRDNEIGRRNPQLNLQKMMAEQEENKHLEDLLEKMQEKEHQVELERMSKEQD